MSDFEKYEFQMTSERNIGNFDDFERLDDYPIHEQPEAEAEERESASSVGDFGASHGDDNLQNFEIKSQISGLHSTDRPLVTLGDPSNEGLPSSGPVTHETMEINLTPDPEENKAAEPFINITAGNVEIASSHEREMDIHVMRQTRHPAEFFGVDPVGQSDFIESTKPTAPEATSIFDPYHNPMEELHTTMAHPQDLLQFETSTMEEEDRHSRASSESPEPIPQPVIKESISEIYKPTKTTEKQQSAAPLVADIEPIAVCPPKMEELHHQEDSSQTESACLFHPRAWFNPSKLDPRVADLIYWRDLKKSGIVFGSGLLALLSLTYFSLISVLAYLLLAVMTGTLSYRIYKNVIQAVQKSSDGHPFKEYLDLDLRLPSDKVREGAEVIVKHLECTAGELRRLFLVEDLVDSLKFAVMLWCFTYIGAWFNGLTLFILAFVALFTLPKVYETHQTQIDHYVGMVGAQVGDIVNKVKAKIPIGKKSKQQ